MSRLMLMGLVVAALNLNAGAIAQTYLETFEQGPAVTMLNGAVTYGNDGPWSARVAGGRLVLSNSAKNDALRYYKLERLQFSTGPQSTEDATIEAAVTVDTDSRAGVGLIARYDPQRSSYVMFAIGGQGEFYVVERKGKARIAMAAVSSAIRSSGVNQLKIRSAGRDLVFEVNGEEVTRFPTETMTGRFVGIAAFGRGLFTFDDVRVTLPGTPQEPPR